MSKRPTKSIAAACPLKREPPKPSDWSDVLALFLLGFAVMGIHWQSIGLSLFASLATTSLFINKPSSGAFPQTFVCILFCGSTVVLQYRAMLLGAETYWGDKPAAADLLNH
jgi:hypothetical protein